MTDKLENAAPTAGLLEKALAAASDTKALHIARGAISDLSGIYKAQFRSAPAVIIADSITFEIEGKKAFDELRRGGVELAEPIILTDPDLHAEWKYVEQLDYALGAVEAIPVAVGAGTVNDLAKLSAGRAGRPYMVVPTAASMDGYTAFGASITYKGSKQTFSCPAPRAVVADLDVICNAPPDMTASGYADLLAKLTAGADWILADALGEELIDPFSWQLVQGPLRYWLDAPDKIRAGDPDAIARLLEGLMMGGFAMQHLQSSRPASGAEHQFSHLWDMQHHTHNGYAPSHGFKVGIGTIASADLYEALYAAAIEDLDVEAVVAAHLELWRAEEEINDLLGTGELGQKALEENAIKHPDKYQLRDQLNHLKVQWPVLREKLRTHLPPAKEIRERLQAVGAPSRSEDIGISSERLRTSYRQATFIRRRFTVLDLANRSGQMEQCLDQVFAKHEAGQ